MATARALAAASPRPPAVFPQILVVGGRRRHWGRSFAPAQPGRPARVVLGESTLEQDTWRWTLAHELGHIALRHGGRADRAATALLAAALLTFLAGVLYLLMTDDVPPAAIGILLGPGLASTAATARLNWLSQRGEYAADRWAAEVGEPVTQAVADRITAREGRTGRLFCLLGLRWLRTHPTPRDRHRAAQTPRPNEEHGPARDGRDKAAGA